MVVQGIALFIAALLGGALNSVAGGGTFLTLPTLIVTGVAPKIANATSTVALWPGSIASVGAYRRELGSLRYVKLMSVVSLVGGALGAILLLRTPSPTFQHMIPYLLLLATVLFAFTAQIKAHVGQWLKTSDDASRRPLIAVVCLQLVIATYGGFFGGGIGILMLATLGLLGLENIHEMNALKTLLATCINGIAVLAFIIAGAVSWPQASVMLVGAIAGGYAGAATARKLDPLMVRRFVIAVGCIMTAYFFIHG